MSMNRTLGGHYGHLDIMLGTQPVTLTLFKPSLCCITFRPVLSSWTFLPEALMNISGHSVLLALRKSVHAPQYMVVIHDSLEHRPLSASYKFGGSANGHNGVKSVIASLSSMDFHRLRIGIGRDKATDPAAYVLQNFPAQERQFWQHGAGIDLVTKELERIVGLLPPG
jgi:PTH1 family peptidyl-tRNA hydrolase